MTDEAGDDVPDRPEPGAAARVRAEYQASKAEAKDARKAIKEAAKLKVQDKVTDVTRRVAGAVVDHGEPPDSAPLEPPWWKGRRGKSQRAVPISREVIVDAAIRVLDAEGADALTVRRLAAELDTGPATLYWHIAGKDELGELVYDRLMGAVELPDPDPARWEEQLKDVARQCYHVMLSHNDAVKLSIGRVPVGPNMLRMIEWSLGLLRGAEIPDEVAGYFGDLLGRYIDASVLEETAHPTFGGNEIDSTEAGAMMADYMGSLPHEDFPNLVAMAGAMFEADYEQRFEMGLDILVRGLAASIVES